MVKAHDFFKNNTVNLKKNTVSFTIGFMLLITFDGNGKHRAMKLR